MSSASRYLLLLLKLPCTPPKILSLIMKGDSHVQLAVGMLPIVLLRTFSTFHSV